MGKRSREPSVLGETKMSSTTSPCPRRWSQRGFVGLLLAIAALTFSGNGAQSQEIVVPYTDAETDEAARQLSLEWQSQQANQVMAEINADFERTIREMQRQQ